MSRTLTIFYFSYGTQLENIYFEECTVKSCIVQIKLAGINKHARVPACARVQYHESAYYENCSDRELNVHVEFV
jgi:hypothetical protein